MSEFAISNLLQNARDGVTKAIMIVDYPHHEIHQGSAYYVEGHALLTDTEQLTVKFSTPDSTKECHFVWHIIGSGETEILLYEDPTGGMSGGTTVPPINNNRNSTRTSSMSFASGVATSTTAKGTQLHHWLSGYEATRPGGSANPSQSGREDELVLKTNSTYLGLIVSNSTQNVSFRAEWYEHAPAVGPKVAD